MVFFMLVVDYTNVVDPIEKVSLLAQHQIGLFIMNIIIYVIFGVLLVVLALALHHRLKDDAPAMVQTATAFALIWATIVIASGMIANIGMEAVLDLHATDPDQAATVWVAIDSVVEGIGGGVEIMGGLWVLLISWVALRAGRLPKALNLIGGVVGAAGIVSIIPALGEIGGMIFGLGQILWFVWLGLVLLLSKTVDTRNLASQPGTR
jgi:hypothetical protein